MNLARVVGTVHAVQKDPNCETAKLLLCRQLDLAKAMVGEPFVAVDMVGAGAGEIVFYTTAYEAVIPWLEKRPVKWALIDAGIVGIVDSVDVYDPKRAPGLEP